MTVALQIRDVPEEIRDVLAALAREKGQSLQAFLLNMVKREAGFARNLALLAQFSGRDDGVQDDSPSAEDFIRGARDERDASILGPDGNTS